MKRIIIEINPQLDKKNLEITKKNKDIQTATEELGETFSQFYEVIEQIRLLIHTIDTLTTPDNYTGIFNIHTSNIKYEAISQICKDVGYQLKVIKAIDI